MTREETIKIIGIITMAYPGFDKFRDEKHIRLMVSVWADMFADDDAGLVAIAVKEHISTSKWPPSIAEIRELMTYIVNPNIIPPDEAWEIVSKYLYVAGEYSHRNYHTELPKAIAESIDAIGYSRLFALHVAYARGSASKAGTDRMAFLQVYEEKMARQRKFAMLPETLRKNIESAKSVYEDGTRDLIDAINLAYQKHRDDYVNSWKEMPLLKEVAEANEQEEII